MRIFLVCTNGLDNKIVAKKRRMTAPALGRWRTRFVVFLPIGAPFA